MQEMSLIIDVSQALAMLAVALFIYLNTDSCSVVFKLFFFFAVLPPHPKQKPYNTGPGCFTFY